LTLPSPRGRRELPLGPGISRTAFAKVVGTVFQAVRRHDLARGFVMKEFFPRRLDGRQFLGCAFRKTHLFARHEERLSDRHVVCAVYTFSWLEHVSGFGLVRSEEHTSELQSRGHL